MDENILDSTVNEELQDSVLEEEREEVLEQDEESKDETSEGEEKEEEGSEEGEESTEEEPKKKLTAEERKQQLSEEIRNLANEKRELADKVAQLEAKFNEQLQKEEASKIDFDISFTKDVLNDRLAELDDEMEQAKIVRDYVKVTSIRQAQDKLITRFDENAAKIFKYYDDQQKQEDIKTSKQQQLKMLDKAAESYRQQNNIPEDVWNNAGVWFAEKCKTDPVVGNKFRELVQNKGPMWAIEYAHNYINETMGKDAKEAKAKKEQAKDKQNIGKNSSSVEVKIPKTFDELMKMSDSEIEAFEKSNPKEFDRILQKKRSTN